LAYSNEIPKLPQRKQDSNKGTFGKVLNIAGSLKTQGAAYLSSISALKTGCGYCVLCSEKEVITNISRMTPDIVFSTFSDIKTEIEKADVIAIGCGLSVSKKASAILKTVLNKAKEKPIVIDADGLNILSKEHFQLPQNTIITPHPKEASRLLKIELEKVIANPEETAKDLTKRYNCITVLKGHRTVVCDKNFDIYINQHGNSALAKAGTGDVLTGVISGLLAQKMSPFEASKLGVYLHSRAGELASIDLTEYSVLASDIPNYINQAIKEFQ